MFKRMLVPLDGSDVAESVLPTARYLAEHFHATIVLFHAFEKDASEIAHNERHLYQVKEAQYYLNKVASQLSAEGIRVEKHIHETPEEDVAKSIQRHAQDLRADLIVLSAHGYGASQDASCGNIALKVIREGTIPILFIQPERMKSTWSFTCDRVLVPLDGNRAHEAVLPIAEAMAYQCYAKMLLMTVVPVVEAVPAVQAAPEQAGVHPGVDVLRAKERLLKIAKDLSLRGLTVGMRVVSGDPSSKIMEVIQARNVDLAVIATCGHSEHDPFAGEGLTPRLLEEFPVPVLMVREYEGSEIQDQAPDPLG